jgi:hypothetical protein
VTQDEAANSLPAADLSGVACIRGHRLVEAIARGSEDKWAGGAVAAGTLLYVAVTAYLSIRKHAYFRTAAFDLGIFESALFNTVQGHGGLLYSSLVDGSQLAVHPSFILLALVPL